MAFRFALCCVGMLAGLTAVAAQPEAIPLAGKPFHAELKGIDTGWTIRFADRQPRTISANELVLWGAFADATRGPQIVLADGGLIVADVRGLDKQTLRAESKLLGEFQCPIELVAGIVFRPPSDRAARDQLTDQLLSALRETDRVLLDNGDELTGKLTELRDGVLVIESENGRVDVEFKKVAAVFLNPATAKGVRSAGPKAWIGLRDGTRALAPAAATDGETTTLRLAGGAELKAPTSAIVALQPLGGPVTYLSDLKAASYRHVPFLQIQWPYRVDRSVTGSYLRAGGRLYLKGLGMHSPARLTYDLDQPYRQLRAELAIDDEAGSRGSVIFRVFIDDGSGKWQPRYASPMVRGGDAPLSMTVDLSGAKRISLLVDYAERGDELDHADWLNARLVP